MARNGINYKRKRQTYQSTRMKSNNKENLNQRKFNKQNTQITDIYARTQTWVKMHVKKRKENTLLLI